MGTTVQLGGDITITVTFRDRNGDDQPINAQSVTATLLKDGVQVDQATPANLDTGVYAYSWIPDATGEYKITFVGNFLDASATPSTYTETISEEISVVDTAGPEIELGQYYELVFMTDVTPMYFDPEEIQPMFPEASLVEIAELVYKFSLEIDKLYEDADEIPAIAYEYIFEAVLCALSSRFSPLGITGEGSSITLGNLSISGGQRFQGTLNRGNASNPCERAYVIKQEILRTTQGSKAVVKGWRVSDQLPDRKIKHLSRGDF